MSSTASFSSYGVQYYVHFGDYGAHSSQKELSAVYLGHAYLIIDNLLKYEHAVSQFQLNCWACRLNLTVDNFHYFLNLDPTNGINPQIWAHYIHIGICTYVVKNKMPAGVSEALLFCHDLTT